MAPYDNITAFQKTKDLENEIGSISHTIILTNYVIVGIYTKQCIIILIIVVICIVVCISLYCISVSNDWDELKMFYYSYTERKQLMKEGKMVHKDETLRMLNYYQVHMKRTSSSK